MKFYSEITNKLYDSEKALVEAETAIKKAEEQKKLIEKEKREKRSARAKEVEDALKVANEAQAKAVALLKAFTKDYGYFHASYSNDDIENKLIASKVSDTFTDLLNTFLNI